MCIRDRSLIIHINCTCYFDLAVQGQLTITQCIQFNCCFPLPLFFLNKPFTISTIDFKVKKLILRMYNSVCLYYVVYVYYCPYYTA